MKNYLHILHCIYNIKAQARDLYSTTAQLMRNNWRKKIAFNGQVLIVADDCTLHWARCWLNGIGHPCSWTKHALLFRHHPQTSWAMHNPRHMSLSSHCALCKWQMTIIHARPRNFCILEILNGQCVQCSDASRRIRVVQLNLLLVFRYGGQTPTHRIGLIIAKFEIIQSSDRTDADVDIMIYSHRFCVLCCLRSATCNSS